MASTKDNTGLMTGLAISGGIAAAVLLGVVLLKPEKFAQATYPKRSALPPAQPPQQVPYPKELPLRKVKGSQDIRKYLAKPNTEFGVNVFDNKAQVLRFTDKLYRLGARSIRVAAIMKRGDEMFADVMLVSVPKALIPEFETRLKEFSEFPDEVRRTKTGLRLWWD